MERSLVSEVVDVTFKCIQYVYHYFKHIHCGADPILHTLSSALPLLLRSNFKVMKCQY